MGLVRYVLLPTLFDTAASLYCWHDENTIWSTSSIGQSRHWLIIVLVVLSSPKGFLTFREFFFT